MAIALATIFQPKVILADEPTTALDGSPKGVLQLLRMIQQETKNTLVIVTMATWASMPISPIAGIMYAAGLEEGRVRRFSGEPLHPYEASNSVPSSHRG